MKSHICLNEHKMQINFEDVITHLKMTLDAPHFGMKSISIFLRRVKQNGQILYNQVLFILHKNVKPSHFHDVIEKEVFDSRSKENPVA